MGLAKTFLAIGIAVILAVFVSYGLYIIYEAPTSNCFQQNCYNYGLTDEDCLAKQDQCYKEFSPFEERHSKISFFILVILGIVSIVTGMYLTTLEGIGSGLIGGGVLIILWSLVYSWRYWITWSKYVKLIALGIVLIILIYFGYKKLEKKEITKKVKKRKI